MASGPNRLAALRALCRKRDCTHVLVSDTVNVEYISGFQSSNAFLLISARQALLFTDFRYNKAASAFCARNKPWQFVEIKEKGFSTIATHIPPGSRVGVESDTMTLDQFDRLKRASRGRRFEKLGTAVSEISMEKSEIEIRSMRKAAAIGDTAYARLLSALRAGITESEAARLLEDICRNLGSEKPSFDTIVLFGSRSALPHGHPTNRRLRNGDWVLVDFGCTYQGFCSDMTRTAVFGTATDAQKQVYEAVLTAQRYACKNIRPGITAREADALARDSIVRAGYGEAFGHATGHGVGLRIHEGPRVSQNDTTVLRENMVVTVEPGIYLSGKGGVRIEDMMVLTARGARSLTRTPRKLVEIAL